MDHSQNLKSGITKTKTMEIYIEKIEVKGTKEEIETLIKCLKETSPKETKIENEIENNIKYITEI